MEGLLKTQVRAAPAEGKFNNSAANLLRPVKCRPMHRQRDQQQDYPDDHERQAREVGHEDRGDGLAD